MAGCLVPVAAQLSPLRPCQALRSPRLINARYIKILKEGLRDYSRV